MIDRNIVICRDATELSEKTAEEFVRLAQESVARSGRFTVALSGGSTPRALYSRLAAPGYTERIPWSSVHFLWGDERCVPPDHPDSNFRMVQESLLTRISIPQENIHRMAGEKDPGVAAAEYEEELRGLFGLPAGELPRFNLILLGMGDDGHTASLFPDTAALNETDHLVVANYVEKMRSHRITLTFPVLNNGENISFLVAGKDKAAVIKKIFADGVDEYPSAQIRPVNGRLTWYTTKDAAEQL